MARLTLETGPVPVSLVHAEPRWFGVPPQLLLLGLAVLSFAIALALFAVGSWPFGLILLGLTAFLAAGFLEVARRRPDSTFTRASSQAASGARSWASSRVELARARSSALAEAQRVRGARSVIEWERRSARLRLGEALQSEDELARIDGCECHRWPDREPCLRDCECARRATEHYRQQQYSEG